MGPVQLDPANRYIQADYQQQKPFASFLPGIAGPLGVPLWAFYVNRGQAMASFGVESKDSPILEFQPANKAYQLTPSTGFRTFLRLSTVGAAHFYEPFARANLDAGASQQMRIGMNELEIEEIAPAEDIQTNVRYFLLPGEPFGGLVRRVTIRNLAQEARVSIDLLDGLPALIPYGVNNFLLKELGRTVEAWMEVFNHPARVPYYRLRASVVDKVEVETYQAGHFALALAGEELLPALVDPALVFQSDTSFGRPLGFIRQPLAELLAARQVTCGRTPCAFFAHRAVLAPGEALTLHCLYGHVGGLEVLQRHLARICHPAYFESSYLQAVTLADDLTQVAATHTADPLFDAYCRQTFLDNVLRGGWPVLLGDPARPQVYPIYSRKHGDPERDYNAFVIAPEPYSQGEGSYRDVNQNRRDNVRFNPAQGDYDVRTFLSLLQLDGFNPRTVKGSTFHLAPEKLAGLLAEQPAAAVLRGQLSKPFTPGRLLKAMADQQLELPVSGEEFLARVLRESEQQIEAVFSEGYWIDHWEYNLDLIESYLAVFPDRQEELLFGEPGLPFYDSPAFVQPRAKKYVLANGLPRQIGSLIEDQEKVGLIAARTEQANWMRTRHGRGEVYRAPIFARLFLTALLKLSTLDPGGMGIEMEAGRPGWYDALNGLPALFGSGLAETYELQRWLAFLRAALQAHGAGALRLPVEAADLLSAVLGQLSAYEQMAEGERDFACWDVLSTARETYRQRTRLGIDGAEQIIPLETVDTALAAFQAKAAAGIARALELNGGLPPTYFTYQVAGYETLPEADPQGRPYIRATRFIPQALPLFLEGPVRALKVQPDTAAARALYQQVKDSPLYDRPLKMYKVNASLADQPPEIGRARAFPPGWLENESIWLHMEYKYLLELLKAGLYPEFFEDFRSALVPFLDPQVYGRSPLENSSFLASSAHPDPSLHGNGFVARLSGSTAEFLSIWNLMMAGPHPFLYEDGQLCLALRPALPGWLFDRDDQLSFTFLGRCTVTYHNPHRLDTFQAGVQPEKIVFSEATGNSILVRGAVMCAPYAARVRSGKVQRIEVYYE